VRVVSGRHGLESVRAAMARLVVVWVVINSGAASAADSAARHTVIGKLDVLEGIASKELPAPRRAFVLLPPGYDAEQRYPVLYALDGQDLFDAATAAGGEELGLDDVLAAGPAGIPALLVVGVEASPHALREYSPPGTMDGAVGDATVRLLVDVLKPLVDSKYSTQPGPAATCVLGLGAGALLAIYATWTRPDVFGGSIAVDLPDLDPRALPPLAQRLAGVPRPRLWIAVAGGDVSERPSSTHLLETLRGGAAVTYVVASPHTSRLTAVAAGLRACFAP